MPLTNFPNGITSFGVPVLGGGSYMTTGTVFFVSSVTGAAGNTGRAADRPLATMNQAVAKCTANKGDIIFLMPNHAENCSTSATQAIATAGISVVGLGSGTDMPTFTYTAAAGAFNITGANTHIENVRFTAGVELVSNGATIDASYVTFRGCVWDFSGAGSHFDRVMDIVNQNYVTVENCQMQTGQYNPSSTSGMSTTAIRTAGADNLSIRGNVIRGYWTSAAIYGTSETDTDTSGSGAFRAASGTPGSTGLLVDVLMAYNSIHNYQTNTSMANGVAVCIDINTASVGQITYNALTLSAAGIGSALALDPGSCRCIENYAVDAADEHGVVVPAASANTTTS